MSNKGQERSQRHVSGAHRLKFIVAAASQGIWIMIRVLRSGHP